MTKTKECSEWINPKLRTAHVKHTAKYSNLGNHKTSATHLVIAWSKENKKSQNKRQNRLISIFRKHNARNSARMYTTAQNSCMYALANLANGACSIFDKLRVRNCQSIKFLLFLKKKIRPIRFEIVSTRKHGCVETLYRNAIIQVIPESKILEILIKGLKKWIFRYSNIITYMCLNFIFKNIRYILLTAKISYLII